LVNLLFILFVFSLQSKIYKLENDIRQLEKQLGVPSRISRNKEEEDMVDTLSNQVNKQKHTISNLNNKVTQITEELEKKKKEVLHLKKTLALRKASDQSKGGGNAQMELEVVPGGRGRSASPEPVSRYVNSNTTGDHELVVKLKHR
jgi:uncharacterized coiled-coil protein SlyX